MGLDIVYNNKKTYLIWIKIIWKYLHMMIWVCVKWRAKGHYPGLCITRSTHTWDIKTMLCQFCKRWPNIDAALFVRVLFSGLLGLG